MYFWLKLGVFPRPSLTTFTIQLIDGNDSSSTFECSFEYFCWNWNLNGIKHDIFVPIRETICAFCNTIWFRCFKFERLLCNCKLSILFFFSIGLFNWCEMALATAICSSISMCYGHFAAKSIVITLWLSTYKPKFRSCDTFIIGIQHRKQR